MVARARRAAKELGADELKIYNRLPVLRAERGLSRKDLADAVGVNYQTIGYLERGDYYPSLELALRLARYFGLPIEMIFAAEPFRPLSEEVAAGNAGGSEPARTSGAARAHGSAREENSPEANRDGSSSDAARKESS